MKAAKFIGSTHVEYVDVEEPKIQYDDEVKIRIHYCGICGSDLSAYKMGDPAPGDTPDGRMPFTHGHEFSGVITEVGKAVTDFKVGDRVTGEPLLYCSECEACRAGYYNACEHVSGLGYGADGAFAEYLVMKAKSVHHIPDSIDDVLATLIEPSAVSYGAVADSGIKKGDTCVVFGVGPIGIMAMQAANAFGAKMCICVDISDDRLAVARKMGATYTINSLQEDPVKKIRELTGNGCDIAIEAAGAEATFNQALECVKSHGQVQCVAMYYKPLTIQDPYAFNNKELTLRMSQSAYIKGRFEKVIGLISDGSLYPRDLISKIIDLDELDKGLEELTRDKSLYKVVVRCDNTLL